MLHQQCHNNGRNCCGVFAADVGSATGVDAVVLLSAESPTRYPPDVIGSENLLASTTLFVIHDGSSLVTNRRPPSVAQRHQIDYTFRCPELLAVYFTAASWHGHKPAAVDATAAANHSRQLQEVGATEASKWIQLCAVGRFHRPHENAFGNYGKVRRCELSYWQWLIMLNTAGRGHHLSTNPLFTSASHESHAAVSSPTNSVCSGATFVVSATSLARL